MTQEMLAEKLGITRSAVCHYLAKRRVPSLDQFVKLAAALECDPAWLQYGVTSAAESEMKVPAKRAKGGAKLNRSKIIYARLTAELHAAAEMMARQQRRTLSSFIEMLVEQAARKRKCLLSIEEDN
jgi:transcriptional regulator with XRE-family HTH domain